MNSAYLVFVDPLSSVEFLTENLRKAGIPSIVIYTLQNLNGDFIRLAPELFDEAFFITDPKNQGDVLRQVKNFRIAGVYAGTETTLAQADQIAKALCPATANNPGSSKLRSSKFEMNEGLRRAGLNAVKQIKIGKTLSEEERIQLLSWKYPLIIKPCNSAGSLGVKLCHDFKTVEAYLAEASALNLVGQEIPYFVVQDYLQGDEYFVDTFSVNGVHSISSIQRYHKTMYNDNPLYLYSEVVAEDDPAYSALADYALKTLDGLEVQHGFAHTEVMLTDKGPFLIELNPRISGFHAVGQKMARLSGKSSQVDLLIAHYQNQAIPKPKQHVPTRGVFLQNYQTRVMQNLNCNLLQSLPSFQEVHLVVAAGTKIQPPQSLLDALGWVILSHPNSTQVNDDHLNILVWEQQERLF